MLSVLDTINQEDPCCRANQRVYSSVKFLWHLAMSWTSSVCWDVFQTSEGLIRLFAVSITSLSVFLSGGYVCLFGGYMSVCLVGICLSVWWVCLSVWWVYACLSGGYMPVCLVGMWLSVCLLWLSVWWVWLFVWLVCNLIWVGIGGQWGQSS